MEDKINDAVMLFNKITEMGFQPTTWTCGTLIKGLCTSGKAEMALCLHKEVGKRHGRSDLRFKI